MPETLVGKTVKMVRRCHNETFILIEFTDGTLWMICGKTKERVSWPHNNYSGFDKQEGPPTPEE